MTKFSSTADYIALLTLRMLAAGNVLFLVSFLIIATLAVGKARADTVACTGQDMLEELATTDGALLRRITEEAARIENGSGLLWRIEKEGVSPSFLFGTMHMTDPRVTDLDPEARKAFDEAGTLVIETTEVLDRSAMLATMAAEPELTMFTDGTTLNSLLSPQDAAALAKALDERGIPPLSVARMKPWMLSAMLALPACELARQAAGAPVLDIRLAEDARAAGKTIAGLETVSGQLRAMASLPMDFHMKGLVETALLGDRVDDMIETMIVLYEAGDTGMFAPFFRNALPQTGGDDASYAEFEETMITRRNHGMIDGVKRYLDVGGAFVAVGALHLPGPEGLVSLLRAAGYVVSPIDG
jgi:uncharacterized protein